MSKAPIAAAAAKKNANAAEKTPEEDVVEGLVSALFKEAVEKNVEARASFANARKKSNDSGASRKNKNPDVARKSKSKKSSSSAVEMLANEFPEVYQAVWKTLYSRSASLPKRGAGSTIGASAKARIQAALDKRLRAELGRYKSSHRLMLKNHMEETRCRGLKARRKRELAIRGEQFNQKLERIRTARLNADLERDKKSRRMNRESQQTLLVGVSSKKFFGWNGRACTSTAQRNWRL